MGKARSQMERVHFRCLACREQFEGVPDRVEDAPDDPWHPWRYVATCRECGAECDQAGWERGLLKAWAHATGPRTDEGKAATAENLRGHPTPEEAQRTRFNAMKHGLSARTATYFPAKPGRYAACERCEHFNNGCDEDPAPGHKNPPACMKRAEIFMRHQIAFDTRDPSLLTSLRADTQAAIHAIVDDMILAIASRGVEMVSPQWYFDPKSGECGVVDYTDPETGERRIIYKVESHPLLPRLLDVLQKNNLSLADMGMTPKVQDDNDILRGNLSEDRRDRGQALEYQEKQTELLADLRERISRSQSRLDRDPVLVEHREAEGGG